MNILLISPHLGIKRNWIYKLFYYRPLSIDQVAAITPKKHHVKILDETESIINFDKDYDLVGISCLTCNALRGYEIADKFRRRGVTVVLGGYHPTTMPQEAKHHADSIVIGEAELTWPKLLHDYENKKLKPFYQSTELIDPELIPPAIHPKRSFSFRPESIQATRGCPVKCSFCSMEKIEGTRFRGRPVKNVIKEIMSIKGKQLLFTDASLTINPRYSKSLFSEMVGLNKIFECWGNINVLGRDDELLKLASEAGCLRWFVGIESISQKVLDNIGKRTNKVSEYSSSVKKIKDHGMMITGLFMFGFDDDDLNVFDRTLYAMNELDFDTVSFSIVTPYPGTRLFEQYVEENRITSYDWSHYNEGNINFIPKNMNQEELLEGIKKISREYLSFSNSFKRCNKNNNLNLYRLIKKFEFNFFFTKEFNKELHNI